jgi:predicted PurR-regulated permease PerM
MEQEPTTAQDDAPAPPPDEAAHEALALDEPQQEPGAAPEPVVIPRWIQAIGLPLLVLAAFALARAAQGAVLVFLIAGVIALILNPLVTFIQRGRMPRGLAVAAVYIGFLAVLAGIGALLANPVSQQVQNLQDNVPDLVDQANQELANLQDWLDERGVDIQIKRQGESALSTLQSNLLEGSSNVVDTTRDLLTRVVEASFGLILVVVISIYMLLYAGRIGDLARRLMPPGDGSTGDDYPTRVQRAVFGYVRGQLLFSLIMGTSAGVALWIYGAVGIFPDGQTYAVAFGAFFAVMELVPYVGPVLGALPPVLVALLQDPLTALWVALLFVGLQQLEGHVVAPQVFGQALRVNPLLVIAALLVGAELYGIIGAFIALPIAAVIRESVDYLSRHTVLEPWDTPPASEILARRRGSGRGDPPPK